MAKIMAVQGFLISVTTHVLTIHLQLFDSFQDNYSTLGSVSV